MGLKKIRRTPRHQPLCPPAASPANAPKSHRDSRACPAWQATPLMHTTPRKKSVGQVWILLQALGCRKTRKWHRLLLRAERGAQNSTGVCAGMLSVLHMKATTKPAKLHHTATCDDRACSRGAVTKCSACWLEQRGTCTYGTSALSPTFDKAQTWSARWRKGRHRARSAMMPRRTVAHTTRRFAALAGRCRPLKRT